jgi:hypothetical protein
MEMRLFVYDGGLIGGRGRAQGLPQDEQAGGQKQNGQRQLYQHPRMERADAEGLQVGQGVGKEGKRDQCAQEQGRPEGVILQTGVYFFSSASACRM